MSRGLDRGFSHNFIFASESHTCVRLVFREVVRIVGEYSPEFAYTAAPLLPHLLLFSKGAYSESFFVCTSLVFVQK